MGTPTEHAAAVAAAIAAFVADPDQTVLATSLAAANENYDGDIGGLTKLAAQLLDQVDTAISTMSLFQVTGEVALVDDLPDGALTGELWTVTSGPMAGHGYLRSGETWIDLFETLRGVQGNPGVGLKPWKTITGAYTAVNGDRVICNSTAGGFTVTLPAGGGDVWLRDYEGSFGVHGVTVDGNGRTILGEATQVSDDGGFQFHFISNSTAWEFDFTYIRGGD